MVPNPTIEGYRRLIFDELAKKRISSHDACCELFGVLSTILAHMKEPSEREIHLDTIEFRFRQSVYKQMEDIPLWPS